MATADVKFILNCTYVQLNQIPVVDKGMAVLFDEQAMSNTLTHENVTIDVQLGLGNAAATAYGWIYPIIMCVSTHHIEHKVVLVR
ncbi:hypothetical protein ACVNPZ_02155 [Staphylococcus aureus]